MIVWEGISRIDHKSPIVAIATWGSKNPKTGNMVQIWIMRADVHPMDALKSDQDRAVCGNCPMRGVQGDSSDRSCYVQMMCVGAIYKKYCAGKYSRTLYDSTGRNVRGIPPALPIRIGAYGDPCAVPLGVWMRLLIRKQSDGEIFTVPHTGYTRQWHLKRNARYAELFHASVFSGAECKKAVDRGFKYFYPIHFWPVMRYYAPDYQSQQCDYTTSEVQCADCHKCCGSSGDNVWIYSHGTRVKNFVCNVGRIAK